MDSLYAKFVKFKSSNLFLFGGPMLTMVIGGAFFLEKFQRVKWEAKQEKYNNELLKEITKQDRLDMHRELRNLQKMDISSYKNIRGPRPYESDEEFKKSMVEQEERMRTLRAQASVI